MTRAPCVALVLSLGGCLYGQDVGAFEPPAPDCPDPGAAAHDAQREACVVQVIEDLAEGPWIGEAASGVYRAQCRVEFGRDGGFRLTRLGTGGDFFTLSFSSTGKVEGKYAITDLLRGEFFGWFEPDVGAFRSNLDSLSISGDELTFTWRTQASDVSFFTSQLVLTRQR